MVQYVDKKTGEVLEVKELSLSTLMGGEVDEQFRRSLDDLARHLGDGDSGKIKIELKATRVPANDYPGNAQIFIEAALSVSYPKIKLNEVHKAQMNNEDKVVEVVDKGLFSGIEEHDDERD